MKTLELGCGLNKVKKDSVGVDISTLSDADVIMDIDDPPWPFDSGSFDEILCLHVFEHLNNRLAVIEEIHRVLVPGGRVIISGPHFSSVTFWNDITHRFPFSFRMFDFLEPDAKIDQQYTPVKFHILNCKIVFYSQQKILFPLTWFFARFPKLWEKFFVYVFPARQVEFVLEAVK